MAGCDTDDGFVSGNESGFDEFSQTCNGSCAGRLDTDAFKLCQVFLCLNEFVISDGFGHAAGFFDGDECFSGVDRIADSNGGGNGFRILFRRNVIGIGFVGFNDRTGALGLNACHLRTFIGDAERHEFFETFVDCGDVSGISDRQETRLKFSRDMRLDLWGETANEDESMSAISIHIPNELADKLESRRILRQDIKAVIQQAEPDGAQFVNIDTGRRLTSYRPKQVTFWVEYSLNEDGSYNIHDAYCHRMAAPGVPGAGRATAAMEGFDEKGGRR